MTVWLADFVAPEEEGSPSCADMARLANSLRSKYSGLIRSVSVADVERPLRNVLAHLQPCDALLGTTDLLRGESAFHLSPKSPWLADPFFAQGRQVLAGRAIKRRFEKYGFTPYFVKSVEEKSHPAPTPVRTVTRHARILRQFLERQPNRAFLVGPIFEIKTEERFFCVDRRIVGSRVYSGPTEGSGERAELAANYLRQSTVRSVALDIASTADGVVLIETNPLFGAGLYGFEPTMILSGCTRRAIEEDYPFLQQPPIIGVRDGARLQRD